MPYTVCLDCASPFSRCPVWHENVSPAAPDGSATVVQTERCWCMTCESIAESLTPENGLGRTQTHEKHTHDFKQLDRIIFGYSDCCEARPEPDVPVELERVPVLALRQALVVAREPVLADEQPPTTWVLEIRDEIEKLGGAEFLRHILAPFYHTLAWWKRQKKQSLSDYIDLGMCRTLYIMEIPDEVLADPQRHCIASVLILRVAVAYRLIDLFSGGAWDTRTARSRVPYVTNETLQLYVLHAQLFADTHLDLWVTCALAQCYDDLFLASSRAEQLGSADPDVAPLYGTPGAPAALRMSMFARYYPHPLRAPYAGEITNFECPFDLGNLWRCNPTTNDLVGTVRHLFFSKPVPYRAMKRGLDQILKRAVSSFPAIKDAQIAITECSMLGNYPGPRFRPRWKMRLVVRRTFHFANLKFEPLWCSLCRYEMRKIDEADLQVQNETFGAHAPAYSVMRAEHMRFETATGLAAPSFPNLSSSVKFYRNQCPHCPPVEKKLWCARECMRKDIFMHQDDLNAPVAHDTRVHEAQADRYVEASAAFEHFRRTSDEPCPHCAEVAAKRRETHLPELEAEQILALHFAEKHNCPACVERTHHQQQQHLCDGCQVVETWGKFFLQSLREFYVFLMHMNALMECVLDATNQWFTYKQIFWRGMDELRQIMDAEYCTSLSENSLDTAPLWARDVDLRARLDVRIGEQIQLTHRSYQHTVGTLSKGTFIEQVMRKLESYNTRHYVNREITAPQRAADFLRNPELALHSRDNMRAALKLKKEKQLIVAETGEKRNVGGGGNECLIGENPMPAVDSLMTADSCAMEPEARRAYVELTAWKQRGFTPRMIRVCAEIAADLSTNPTLLRLILRQSNGAGRGVRINSVFYRIMRLVGITAHGLDLINRMVFDHQAMHMPNNHLGDCVEGLARHSRVDFYIFMYFCECFMLKAPVRIFPLDISAARAQMAALRRRYNIPPTDDAPADIDVHRVCLKCFTWYSPVVKNLSDLQVFKCITKHGGEASAVDPTVHADGHGKLLRNLTTGDLVCSSQIGNNRDKKFGRYGLLNRNMHLQNEESASAIRRARETNVCRRTPLVAIAMLGAMVRIRDVMNTICVECGALFTVTESTTFVGGTLPMCDLHGRFGREAETYTGILAFLDPIAEALPSGEWVKPLGMTREHLDAELNRDELRAGALVGAAAETIVPLPWRYVMPSPALYGSETRLASAAAEGFLPCSWSITQPKGAVEAFAVGIIQSWFQYFGRTSSTSAAPAASPLPTEAEMYESLAHCLMTYGASERRIRRENMSTAQFAQQRIGSVLQDPSEAYAQKIFDDAAAAAAAEAARSTDAERAAAEQTMLRAPVHGRLMKAYYRTGAVEMPLMILCAYCGKAADKVSKFVRMNVLDVDRLCRNRYTMELAPPNPTMLQEIFLCERNFTELAPLLQFAPTPFSSMVFVFLRCRRDMLQAEQQHRAQICERGAMVRNTAVEDYIAGEARNETDVAEERMREQRARMKRGEEPMLLGDAREDEERAEAAAAAAAAANKRPRLPMFHEATSGHEPQMRRRGRPPGSGRGRGRGRGVVFRGKN